MNTSIPAFHHVPPVHLLGEHNSAILHDRYLAVQLQGILLWRGEGGISSLRVMRAQCSKTTIRVSIRGSRMFGCRTCQGKSQIALCLRSVKKGGGGG